MRMFIFRFFLSAMVLLLIVGTGCRGDTPASIEPVGDLQGIYIENHPGVMTVGQVHALRATGLYPGSATFNITGYATWMSSNPSVIELLGKGILHAVGGGTATISVSYKGVTSSVNITVLGPPAPLPPTVTLTAVQIEPAWTAVKIGETVQFTATAIYSNGATQPITSLADWRVSNPEIGFIIDSDNVHAYGPYWGLFRATGPPGATTISAVYSGMVSNYATVIVREY